MTTVSDLEKIIISLKIKTYFTGVKMLDELGDKPRDKECGILNLNSSDVTAEENSKTGHWIAYYKNGDEKYHFCSYGSPPPRALINYFGSCHTHTFQIQQFGSKICGELACLWLHLMDKGISYFNSVLFLLKINETDNAHLE